MTVEHTAILGGIFEPVMSNARRDLVLRGILAVSDPAKVQEAGDIIMVESSFQGVPCVMEFRFRDGLLSQVRVQLAGDADKIAVSGTSRRAWPIWIIDPMRYVVRQPGPEAGRA